MNIKLTKKSKNSKNKKGMEMKRLITTKCKLFNPITIKAHGSCILS